jgi:hypothetical protein
MADIVIDSVSASFTGTDNADDFQNATGNLRDITVKGLSGDDLLSFGSAVQVGTAAGGRGLGFSIASSDVGMGGGEDTITFSGQAGSGSSKFNSTKFKLGADDDYLLVNGIVSASGSVVKGNEGADEMIFANVSGGGTTASDLFVNGGSGSDTINVSWTGTEANGIRVLGGRGDDTISGTYQTISARSGAQAGQSGLLWKGNKGADIINLNILGVANDVKINGNSGSDTIAFTAESDITNLTIGGGKDSDVITATLLNAQSALGVTVNGNDGDDTVVANFSGSFVSGLTVGGNAGDDAITFFNSGASLTAGSANSILGGTGADTITLNLGSNVSVTGASGFVADLGVAGVSAVSGGTAGLKGGLIDINLSATMNGQTGAGIFFKGTNSDDVITVNNDSGNAFGLNNASVAAGSGADTITLETESGGAYSAVSFNGGAGNDVFTAQFGLGTTQGSLTGGRISFNGEAGADAFVVNVESGGLVSASIFDGGTGNDTFVSNVLTGASLRTFGSGTEYIAGSGADTIGFIGATGSRTDVIVAGGVGADLITGTFASAGTTNGLTADAGAGADTIALTYTASQTAGRLLLGGNGGGVIDGGADADSINVIAAALSGGTFNFGTIRGGDGADTITFGGEMGSVGAASAGYTGSINGGGGADSIIFSGNNVVSAGGGFFKGGTNHSGGFQFASGDSVVGSFDTVFVSNNAITGGQAQGNGTFASAGFVFSGFTSDAAGNFTMTVATGGVLLAGSTGGETFGDAIFTSDAIVDTRVALAGASMLTGGLVGAQSDTAGGAAGVAGTYILSGGSTLGQIFSSVDSVVNGRGKAAVFNVQNGSGGHIDGFLFVDGGTLSDTIVKFDGSNALNAAYTRAGGVAYFSAGAALKADKSNSTGSGGTIFFEQNVGIG